MKAHSLSLFALAALIAAPYAHATCSSAAAYAAETEYGNDPVSPSKVKILIAGEKYEVTVGKDNVEDGPHTYIVTFKNGVCDPRTAEVTEINE